MVLDFDSGRIQARLEHTVKTLVDRVSFSLDEGKSMALIGESGSGKTMTAMSLMGLLPANVRMEQGKIMFEGRELKRPGDFRKVLGTEIVYIPQNGLECLNPSKLVRSHLYDSLKKMGISRSCWESLAIAKLSCVGFTEPEQILDKYPFQLSGGMAQRVTIAIAACSQAKLVIADEPTNGLDHEAKVKFMGMLKEIFPRSAKLIITHDIGVAQLCDRTLVLCGGRMMECGESEELLETPKHPYTKALMGALVKNGMMETPVLREYLPSAQPADGCPFFRRCPRAMTRCTLSHRQGNKTEWWCSEA